MTKGKKVERVTISPPNFKRITLKIRGTVPLVLNAFPEKARQMMRDKQEAGSTAKSKKTRESKDFDLCYEQAKHKSRDGWDGIPAAAFRKGMISACRLVNFKMTLAKLSVFTEADGYDVLDGTPLVRITKGDPHQVVHPVRNATGVADLRSRPMWDEGWEALVQLKWDADQFTVEDVTNLMLRVGEQIGVGEGRNDSPKSAGMGWGSFEIVND